VMAAALGVSSCERLQPRGNQEASWIAFAAKTN
jgi:hypothetical protein